MDLVGRIDDVIRSGGESVYPEEVEAVLATHPAIREAAVIGVPDPLWGEMVVACVALRGRSRMAGLRRPLPGEHARALQEAARLSDHGQPAAKRRKQGAAAEPAAKPVNVERASANRRSASHLVEG